MPASGTITGLATLLLAGWLATTTSAADPPPPPLQVFILAGQSNMQGQGVVDLDHPKHYNGGRGTLLKVIQVPANAKRYAHVRTAGGDWVVRDDVFVRFRTREKLKSGGLSIGFAGYPGKHHIGPEFQFGHVVGDAIQAPVLLIKTAWGGKSLYRDFRPPSATGPTGAYYHRMLSEVHAGLARLQQELPKPSAGGYRLAGFVWFQGWNDMFDGKARSEYQQNLVHLVNDVRRDLRSPGLPVVIGELGNGGPKAGKNMLAIRAAQAEAARRSEGVAFVSTTAFARPAQDSPNVGHGHHWFGNAESYFLIGDALGRGMLKLLAKPTRR
ncbi:MAG: sialate O-acetylesterase [Planctomycetaceae bacterium]|jgi:hypothetical protein|nr:sialate O-acetylesterase [Planctomycetaceae bacterium]